MLPTNVGRIIGLAATLTPNAVALNDGDVQLTYRALDARYDRVANGLRSLGVEPGDLCGRKTPAALMRRVRRRDAAPPSTTRERIGPSDDRVGRDGRLETERPVGPLGVVEADELGEDRPQVLLVDDDEVVQALAAQTADRAFGDGIRARRPHRREHRLDAYAPGPLEEVTP